MKFGYITVGPVVFEKKFDIVEICCCCCFTSTVNILGHVGMVSFPGQA